MMIIIPIQTDYISSTTLIYTTLIMDRHLWVGEIPIGTVIRVILDGIHGVGTCGIPGIMTHGDFQWDTTDAMIHSGEAIMDGITHITDTGIMTMDTITTITEEMIT